MRAVILGLVAEWVRFVCTAIRAIDMCQDMRLPTLLPPPRSLVRPGATLVEVVVAIAILGVLAGLLLPAIQRVRATAARAQCVDKLRQIGLALTAYHASHAQLPPGVSNSGVSERYPFMNWHVRILPHLEQSVAWSEATSAYDSDRDFTHSPPHEWSKRPMRVFSCPADGRVHDAQNVHGRFTRGLTSYLGNVGVRAADSSGVLYLNSSVRVTDIHDGSSNTLLVGERPPSADLIFGWWYAGWGQDRDGEGDSVLGARTKNIQIPFAPHCPIGPYHYGPGQFNNQCDAFHFWSPHSGGANFVFADGSARFLAYSADSVLPALATRAGGEVAVIPD